MIALSSSRRPSKRLGFSLVELSLVMGIIGIILSAIWVAAGNVMENARVRTMTDTLMIIVDNLHNFYSSQNQLPATAAEGTKTAYTNTLATAKVFPDGTLKTVGTNTLPFGVWANSNIYVYTGSSSTYFRLEINNVPEDSCKKIISGIVTANGLNGIKSGATWKHMSANSYGGTPPSGSTLFTSPVDITCPPASPAATGKTQIQLEFSMHYAPM